MSLYATYTASGPSVPTNTAPPTISGTAQQGQTLTEHVGTWKNEPTSFEYQWLQCDGQGNDCVAISEATSQIYTPTVSDVGHTIRMRETASNAAGSASATSEPTLVVLAQSPPPLPVPSGLPPHFGIGLGNVEMGTNGLRGWMPASRSPWDYANNYLSGGVNTGTGWATWANGSGTYVLQFANAAHSDGYIPVFSYYNLFQSNGSCNSCSEPNKDLSNLNNPSTMAAFYEDFRLALQRLGTGSHGGIQGFGHTAILHVEPDLSGYAEQAVLNNTSHCFGFCTSQGNNPGYLRASVSSSGVGDVSAYPDTYQGFNWALLHLRDLYAPNVLLAIHVSGWATGPDIDGDTSATLNAASLGQEAGTFAAESGITGNPSGLSSYDVIFNDVANTDSANSGQWWDQLNVTFPNFARWDSYINAITLTSARPAIVWQVPMGNQYYDTLDNSSGRTQDNRAQYFFSHIGELASNGLIGMIFGDGGSGTKFWDATGDGTGNPPSFCTTDGLSSGQICNDHASLVSDDDGGFIRTQALQYYANPYLLNNVMNTR
jgi:hypothetical protein